RLTVRAGAEDLPSGERRLYPLRAPAAGLRPGPMRGRALGSAAGRPAGGGRRPRGEGDMRVTFITPHVGRKRRREDRRTWQMEPLTIATLAGLTPPDVEVRYFDERIEAIDFEAPADLVAITVETYTAKRAYEIAAEYHRRGVRVILGGYHVTLLPDEAQAHAD